VTQGRAARPIAKGTRLTGLDGLRGLAILGVFLFHASAVALFDLGINNPVIYVAAQAGWIGVDLFFVLSGYLITRILLETKQAPNFYKCFWARRALRIVPAYFALLLFVFALWRPLAAPGLSAFQTGYTEIPILAYVAFISNFFMAVSADHGYLPLSITWSLAIEAQFYLIWPFVVRHLTVPGLLRLIAVLLVAAPVARLVALASGVPELSLYVLTPLRCDGLLAGALIAGLQISGRALPRATLSAVCFAVLCLAFLAAMLSGLPSIYGNPLLIALKYSIVAGMFFFLVVSVLQGGKVRRLVEAAPGLRGLGRVSYGFYLWHFFLLLCLSDLGRRYAAGQLESLGNPLLYAALLIAGAAATLAVSLVSWAALESPLLKLKRRFAYGVAHNQCFRGP